LSLSTATVTRNIFESRKSQSSRQNLHSQSHAVYSGIISEMLHAGWIQIRYMKRNPITESIVDDPL